MQTETIKSEIKKSYGAIAKDNTHTGCCTDKACCTSNEFSTSMIEDYSKVEGYQKEADLSLGCGLPTEIANIKQGDTVIDLGSGAGNDVYKQFGRRCNFQLRNEPCTRQRKSI